MLIARKKTFTNLKFQRENNLLHELRDPIPVALYGALRCFKICYQRVRSGVKVKFRFPRELSSLVQLDSLHLRSLSFQKFKYVKKICRCLNCWHDILYRQVSSKVYWAKFSKLPTVGGLANLLKFFFTGKCSFQDQDAWAAETCSEVSSSEI